MDLYVLRHAVAVAAKSDHPGQDSGRALTPDGERKMRRIAEGLLAGGLSFDLILSSPYLRAKQTAEIVTRVFDQRKILRFSAALAPQAQPEKLIEELNVRHPKCASVLVVGHEPYLSRLISVLAAGGPGLAVKLRKGGLCKLSVTGLRAGSCASLEWLLTPRQVRGMA